MISIKGLKTYLPAFVTGCALVAAFPWSDHSWVAFVALAPLLASLWKAPPLQALKTGLLAGVIYFFGTLYWIYHSVHFYGGLGLGTSLGVAFALALGMGVYVSVFAFFFSRVITNTSLPASLVAPLFWVVLEFLRSVLFTGFPWALLGYSQYEFLRFIQISDITGVYGVSFIVVAVNGALADIYISGRRRVEMPLFALPPTLAGYAVVLLMIVVSLIYGTVRLGEDRAGEVVRASIVQGNIEQDAKWNPMYQNMVTGTYRKLSSEAMVLSPDIIIWPETSMPFVFSRDDKRREELLSFQKGLGTPLLLGVPDRDGGGGEGGEGPEEYYTNSAVLMDHGKAVYQYDKIHLVPFGEYVPLRALFFFVEKLVEGFGEYKEGDSYERGKIEQGEFGTLICYEVIFPNLVRKFFLDGGDFIVNITNDAWFGRTPGPYQHLSMTVFRAVENRKPILRAANTGISAVISSNGKIEATTELFERTVLTREFSTDSTRTFYTRFGDLFVYLCSIISVVILLDIRRA